jgi:hypothetical protein
MEIAGWRTTMNKLTNVVASMAWLMAGCSAAGVTGGAGDLAVAAPVVDAAVPAPDLTAGGPLDLPPPTPGFVVHEWGTYTSTVASTGEVMAGMQHEEEPLPGFVLSRGTYTKGMETLADGVNQKLETPVLYFYAPGAMNVKVVVDFPQGIVSQWFPTATSYLPEIDYNGALAIKGGRMQWDAALTPGATGFPSVTPDSIWEPSRHVASVPVVIGSYHEQFIFYRGIGTFSVPFAVTAGANDAFSAKNDSNDPIQTVFLLRVHDTGGAILNLGPLGAHDVRSGIVPPVNGKEVNIDQYVVDASAAVAVELVKSGLNQDEARAMVDTWSRSYFRSFGTRLLYIAPRAWTDALLPITITPTPSSLVRTLVGRVELLTQADEAELVARVQAAAAQATPAQTLIQQLGRLAEPKLRRTLELLQDNASQQYCTNAIGVAKATP